MTNLTDQEIAVLRALANNNYGDNGDGVWSWAVEESSTPSNLPKTSIPGVVGSLCKKGLIRSEEYERNEWVIWMNDLGRQEIIDRQLVEA